MKFRNYLMVAGLGLTAFSSLHAQRPFPAIDTNFVGTSVNVPPSPFQFDIIFQEGVSTVVNKDGQSALARGNHDYMEYLPIAGSSEHGRIIVNHELRDSSTNFGDGGGMTVFEVRKTGGRWANVGPYRNVDFSNVGGTYVNCGGAKTPHGTVLTAEEYPPQSNPELYGGGRLFRDTSDFEVTYNGQQKTLKRWQNMGWMVEVDPENAQAVRKLFKMGRFSHEGAWCMEDGKTVYLTDDFSPAVFFKFIATTAGDYSDGQLYAYKQALSGNGGEWITLPMEMDSLIQIRDVALRLGATMFIRHEWPVGHNGKIYITETGSDAFNWGRDVRAGRVPARHLREHFATSDSTFVDFFGRILEFDPATDNMRVYLNGGNGRKDRTINFASADGLTTITNKGKTYFVVQEDLNGITMGRVNLDAQKAGRLICEAYWLDASIENPTIDDLSRFIIGSQGAELTGGIATPDGSTFFVNNQHPSRSNPAPFNTSASFAITGFDLFSGISLPDGDDESGIFRIYPNPASRTLQFNRRADVAIYDAKGARIQVERDSERIDISTLTPGVYFVQTVEGDVQKLIVE